MAPVVVASTEAPPVPVEADERPPERRRPRWLWPTLVVAGWVALIAAALLWTVDGVHADRTERTEPRNALPGIQPGSWVEQAFTARDDGLSSVAVRFGTFDREMSCTLDTSLRDDGGTLVAVGTLPCAGLVDAELTRAIVMPPIPDSAGRTFRLRIAMQGEAGDGLTYFGGPPADGQPPATLPAPTTTTDALELHTAYGVPARAVAQLGVVFDRLDDYGAPWRAPVAVVALVLGAIALLAAATIAPARTGVVLVVAFAVVKGILWSVVVPPFKGPDEPAHFAYAQFLAVERGIPGHAEGPVGRRGYSDELRAALDVFGQDPRSVVMPPGDRPGHGAAADVDRQRLAETLSRESSGTGPAVGQAPVFYLVPAAAHGLVPGPIDARLGVMRLWSVALGAFAVWATVMFGRRLFPRHQSAALLLGVAVALQPMLSQQTAVVTNDAPLIAMGALCTWVAVALTDPERSRWWAPLAGLAFGLAMLAKPRALVFAPVLAIAWLIGRRRGARAAPWWWEAGGGALGLLVTYGLWWLYQSAGAPVGETIPSRPGDHTFGDFTAALTDEWFRYSRQLWVDHLWGNFGWLHHPFPAPVQGVILGALLVGSVIVLAWLAVSVRDAVQSRQGRGPWRRSGGATLATHTTICLLVVGGSLAVLYVLMWAWYRSTGGFDLIQGRYALPALPAMLALPVLALERLAPRLSPVVPLAVVASAMAVLNVIGVSVVVSAMYL